jgi:hypothetical protein
LWNARSSRRVFFGKQPIFAEFTALTALMGDRGRVGAAVGEEVSEQPPLVHLTMWYYAASDEPCLQISYGVPPLRGKSSRPGGWSGAYQEDPDGRGYTLE